MWIQLSLSDTSLESVYKIIHPGQGASTVAAVFQCRLTILYTLTEAVCQ